MAESLRKKTGGADYTRPSQSRKSDRRPVSRHRRFWPKAFRGEMVPQDENDEPAEHLLSRIRAEWETVPKAKRKQGAMA